ncbi:CocE/NonD family hydrolase [Roseivirga sp. BDSF3-8]|uniref:CocE/NonD family hydrolase n=1 Tax=Roseivirga sp. BDSF3-8 TaxID=3241598 RepID=UPI003531A41B
MRQLLCLLAMIATAGTCLTACQSGTSAATTAARPEPPTMETNSSEGLNLDSLYIVTNYTKKEYRVPMRDGATLFTQVYSPKDDSKEYPIMLFRTPYSNAPYGEDQYKTGLGPNMRYVYDGYIFVYQDVRGKFMSEGTFVNMTPHVADKEDSTDIDESSDTYDTVEWLMNNIDNHNGRVGQWGISYPGFYTAAGAINAHPAMKAVSPQAPIADWFWDDFHHHGAFFLPHTFNFIARFGQERPELTTEWPPRFDHGTPDGYRFFLDMGPLKNAKTKYFGDRIGFWDSLVAHPNYDEFWQRRNLLPHLKDVKPATLVVGGWYDAEDLYGPLKIYEEIEKVNPRTNYLVMGPWRHGGWNRDDGSTLGKVYFSDSVSWYYQEKIEYPFFTHHLHGGPEPDLSTAMVYETGGGRWREFDSWPPENVQKRTLYFTEEGLTFEAPAAGMDSTSFISDPDKPVPFTEETATGMTREYMTDDQRFAGRRPDVLMFRTEPLEEDVTLAGGMMTHLKVATTGTDADWVVKLIDEYPPDHEDYAHNPEGVKMGGYQQMVRSEVIRGRFRNSYENPEPFTPNEMTEIDLPLQDVLHTFKKGHRIVIQVQSTWFPIVDRNPQKYVPNIWKADEEDFIKATHTVYHSSPEGTRMEVTVLPE